ncbi:MAG: hypothetical protein KGY80_03125 [Candidatus Thorarchaeota archaeon]|nr:hypothetical protein [Candidatus Thorarchaeota archaeon]
MDLDHVFGKLRFDESVSAYSLFTNDGEPFLSFSMPETIVLQLKGTMKAHSSSLTLVNVLTSAGTVVLSRVDPHWVLAVLFEPKTPLGASLQSTRDVVEDLQKTDLPEPPKSSVDSTHETSKADVEVSEAEEPRDIVVRHGCIVRKDEQYSQAMMSDSELRIAMTDRFGNLALDVLLMVDEKRTIFQIAELLDKQVDRIIPLVEWLVSKRVVRVQCPSEQETGTREIVECPVFSGDSGKTNREHREVLELCDGTRTVQEIAEELNLQYFQALQAIVPYRGKSVKFVRTNRIQQR